MNTNSETQKIDIPETGVAPAGRAGKEGLERDISLALENRVIREIMALVDGLVLVLNPQRQIVALNKSLQSFIGVEDPSLIFGKRPGEAISCVYSGLTPGGCGASASCSSCGVVAVIAECQGTAGIVQRKCPVRLCHAGGDHETDIVLSVRACPVEYKDSRFVVVFMHDITEAENKSRFESMFFHDALNTLNSIISSYRLIKMNCGQEERDKYLDIINMLSNRLSKDIKIHSMLSKRQAGETITPELRRIDLGDFMGDMGMYMKVHTENHDICLEVTSPDGNVSVKTDPNLLHRVVMNMLINAAEASEKGDTIRLWAGRGQDGRLSINVWNRKPIEPMVAARMFQRFYSTKAGSGRGIGTQSMKYIGEKLLGGRVYFASTPEDGTVFTFELTQAGSR